MFPIPANSPRIRYLESTGTQYIDTGIAVSNPSTIRVEADEDVLQPIGFTHQNNGNGTWLASYAPTSVPTSNYVYYGTYANRTIITANENRKTAVYDGASGYYENGVQLISFVAGIGSDSIAGRNWLFGAVWDFNASSADMRHSRQGKIYGLKVYVSGVLVRSFVPVRIGSTGYLFDRVSGQLFGNAGTGDFVLGPDTFSQGVVPTRLMPMGVRKKEVDLYAGIYDLDTYGRVDYPTASEYKVTYT